MQVNIFSIFPEMLKSFLEFGLLSKAVENQIIDVSVWDLREGSDDKHGSVDDVPFGGGPGMLLRPEPIFKMVEKVEPPRPLYLLSPTGRKIDQKLFVELSQLSSFSLLCGRYEGVDARVDELIDGELSLGDFILQGGEIASMAILEGVSRLLEGSLGNKDSASDESFSDGLLEYPQYTRPGIFNGMEVPAVLRSGNHERIKRWQKAQALLKTQKLRPDLIEARGGLIPEEKQLLEELESGELDE